ncbi:MAG: hypothetical protein C0483_18025 [Pirellula sp.]|nr:hypothetical protein [Pirellula sp.]
MKHVFVLATGRSGTHFLHSLCRANVREACCRHEPYFTPRNPNMFGKAIDAHTRGDEVVIRRLIEKKQRYVSGLRTRSYIETSHAFLKSYYDLAPEYFDDLRVFYLLRDPVKTALSEANRHQLIDRLRIPFCHYRGADGKKYFRWSLTGNEPIYQSFRGEPLTLFQHYFLQWIETQNRAVWFLDRFEMHDRCAVLDSPRELNDPGCMKAAFEKLELPLRESVVRLTGGKNRTPGVPTEVTQNEEQEAEALLKRLPYDYLTIFQRPMFARFGWTAQLLKHVASTEDRSAPRRRT